MRLNVGKLGALPRDAAQFPPEKDLLFSSVKAALPENDERRVPPFMHDTRPKGAAWRMLGNNKYGNCTFAAIVRIMLNNAQRRGKPITDITDDDVIKAYLDLNDGVDKGAMPVNALTYMRNYGIKGHKVTHFARVSDRDVYERQSALMTFGSLYVASGLPLALDDDRDLRWELKAKELRGKRDEPRSLGGHAYPVFGYQRGEEFSVPWDQEVIEEADWTDYYRVENWVFIDNGETDQGLIEVMVKQLAAIKAV